MENDWEECKKLMPPIGEFVLVYDPTMQWTHNKHGYPLLKYGIASRVNNYLYLSDSGDLTTWKEITHWRTIPKMGTKIKF